MYFEYSQKELEYLKKKDNKLSNVIDKIGMIQRKLDEDLFSSVVHHIIGQQISVLAQATVWKRMNERLSVISVESIAKSDIQTLQKCGMTFKKAEYIKCFAQSVLSGELILDELYNKSDEEIIKSLCSIKGIGVWTAEMIMTFCMQRPNILSFGDLAILRGMRMLYRHKKITPELFAKYKKRFSPYNTTAALYFWAIAGGALPELTDPAFKVKKVKK